MKSSNIFRDCYILFKDIPIQDVKFNDNEVMNCKYVTINEFKSIISEGKSTFTDFNQTIFNNYEIDELRKELY